MVLEASGWSWGRRQAVEVLEIVAEGSVSCHAVSWRESGSGLLPWHCRAVIVTCLACREHSLLQVFDPGTHASQSCGRIELWNLICTSPKRWKAQNLKISVHRTI